MAEQGCRKLCMGLAIHYPYYLEIRADPAESGRCFSLSQKADFQKYVREAALPALACAAEWLDAGAPIALSVSGLFIEQLLEDDPGGADLLSEPMQHRHTENLGQTYYHSVAGLFSSGGEFAYQAGRHADLLEEIAGRRPVVFENTEFVFPADLAATVAELGFHALYAEGYDHLLAGMSPNSLYSCRGLPVLLRNCRLSDDIAHRFSDHTWDQYPLSAEKYAAWIGGTPGDCIHLLLDAGIFAEGGENASSLREFFSSLPGALADQGVTPVLPASVLGHPLQGEIVPGDPGLCGPGSACPLTGIQNMYQQAAFWCLEDAGNLLADSGTWRRLQSTDHFTRMALSTGSCGRVPARYSSQEAYDYFTAYLQCLARCEATPRAEERAGPGTRALRCTPPERAFHFYSGDRYEGYSAYSLREFSNILAFVPDEVFSFHQGRGDFSRWIWEVLGDEELAARIGACTTPGEAADRARERVRELCSR